MTIDEFTRAQRVERARQLLVDPSLSLAQIARLAGFSDQSHLTRLLRRCLKRYTKAVAGRAKVG